MEHISTYTEEKSRRLSHAPRVVRWAIVIAIVIVLNLFFLAMRDLVFSEPQFNTFCPPSMPVAPASVNTSAAANSSQSTCSLAYQTAQNNYQLHTFVLLIVLGIIAIIIGIIPLGSSIVASGLSFGGVVTLILAAVNYWDTAGSWLRLGISLIALIALIVLSIKRFQD